MTARPAMARPSGVRKNPAVRPPGADAHRRLLLRSKSHQLAEYLRDSIRQGRLVEPLPGMRRWSR